MNTVFKMDVVNSNGIPFRVVLLTDGVSENYGKLNDSGEAEVEFYDRRHSFSPDGQFTGARYYLSTLMEDRGWNPKKSRGFNLNGGVEDWSLDAQTYEDVIVWLEGVTRNLSS